MITHAHSLLQRYLACYPHEAPRLAAFAQFLAQTPPDAQWKRQTPGGHLTASGVVLDLDRRKVLLVHHVVLDRWLQPGGHIEPADASFPAAAVREVTEETGLPPQALTPLKIAGDGDVPFDIDSHPIPARPTKGEAAHTHHDLRYVFTADASAAMTPDMAEIHAARWCDWSALAAPEVFGPLLKKIETLLRPMSDAR